MERIGSKGSIRSELQKKLLLGLVQTGGSYCLLEALLCAGRWLAVCFEKLSGWSSRTRREVGHHDIKRCLQLVSHPSLKPGRHASWIDLTVTQLANEDAIRVQPRGERAEFVTRQIQEWVWCIGDIRKCVPRLSCTGRHSMKSVFGNDSSLG